MRPSDGYLLFAPWGPCWSKFSAREMTLPLRTRRAAATMSSAVVLLSVPISSAGPHLPQLLYFSAASARSLRVSFAAAIAFLHLFFWPPFYPYAGGPTSRPARFARLPAVGCGESRL